MPTFTNQAQLSYDGIVTNSNVAVGEIVEVLSINKNVLTTAYENGERLTYVINLVNAGTTPFTNLTVTDNLGAYEFTPTGTTVPTTLVPLTYVPNTLQYYQDGVLQAMPTISSTNPLTVEGIAVPANGNSTLVFNVEPNQFANPSTGSTITNTATATGTDLSAPISDTATVTAADGANLAIYKSITPRQVPENGQVTYTFDITNTGNTAAGAANNLIVTDTFDPVLTNISVTYNGTPLDASQYNYSPVTGVFSTNPGAITVPAATSTVDETTGAVTTVPGTASLVVTGTI